TSPRSDSGIFRNLFFSDLLAQQRGLGIKRSLEACDLSPDRSVIRLYPREVRIRSIRDETLELRWKLHLTFGACMGNIVRNTPVVGVISGLEDCCEAIIIALRTEIMLVPVT